MRFLNPRPEWPRLCLSLVVLALTACEGATTTSGVPAAPVAPRATVCVIYDEAGDIAFSATTGADAPPLYSIHMAAGGEFYTGKTLAQLEALWP